MVQAFSAEVFLTLFNSIALPSMYVHIAALLHSVFPSLALVNLVIAFCDSEHSFLQPD